MASLMLTDLASVEVAEAVSKACTGYSGRVDIMFKSEMLAMHAALVRHMEWLIRTQQIERTRFEAYEKLGVSPVALHRNRIAHKKAIKTLLACMDELHPPHDIQVITSSRNGKAKL